MRCMRCFCGALTQKASSGPNEAVEIEDRLEIDSDIDWSDPPAAQMRHSSSSSENSSSSRASSTNVGGCERDLRSLCSSPEMTIFCRSCFCRWSLRFFKHAQMAEIDARWASWRHDRAKLVRTTRSHRTVPTLRFRGNGRTTVSGLRMKGRTGLVPR